MFPYIWVRTFYGNNPHFRLDQSYFSTYFWELIMPSRSRGGRLSVALYKDFRDTEIGSPVVLTSLGCIPDLCTDVPVYFCILYAEDLFLMVLSPFYPLFLCVPLHTGLAWVSTHFSYPPVLSLTLMPMIIALQGLFVSPSLKIWMWLMCSIIWRSISGHGARIWLILALLWYHYQRLYFWKLI